MDAPNLYHVDRSGAFDGSVSRARLSPADAAAGRTVWLIPNGATTLAPPEAGDGEVAVLRGSAWSVLPDYRGRPVYDKATRARRVVEEPGALDEDCTLEAPPSPRHEWTGGAWVLPLAAAKAARLAEVAAELAQRNAAGFAHGGKVFQIDDASQARITALAVKASLVIGGVAGASWPQGFRFIAADNTGAPFDAAGFVGFADAASNIVIARRLRARALKDAIVAAADATALAAIDVTAGWG